MPLALEVQTVCHGEHVMQWRLKGSQVSKAMLEHHLLCPFWKELHSEIQKPKHCRQKLYANVFSRFAPLQLLVPELKSHCSPHLHVRGWKSTRIKTSKRVFVFEDKKSELLISN